MQGTISSFFVRTVQHNRTTNPTAPRPLLILEPPNVEFVDYPSSKISICKLTLKNNSRLSRRIALTQPTKTYFEVKIRSKDLAPKEITEVYVIFNPQK